MTSATKCFTIIQTYVYVMEMTDIRDCGETVVIEIDCGEITMAIVLQQINLKT